MQKKIIVLLFLGLSGCLTQQVKQPDEFVIGGMERPHVVPRVVAGAQMVLPQPQRIKTSVKVPKGYYVLTFFTPFGERVRLMVPLKGHSVGAPNNGRLEGGECIPKEGAGYVHFGPNSCGNSLTITITMYAIGQLHRAYPDTPPVVIGSISKPGGGPLKGHRSHQNGLDIDIGYIPVANNGSKYFKKLPPSGIDFDKTFFLIACMLATGMVRYVFVDYSLQPYLFDAARAMGYTDDQLDVLFQYPRGRYVKKGIIRYSPGHRDHFHVRFRCPPPDDLCKE